MASLGTGKQDLSCLRPRAPGGGLLRVCIEGTPEEFHLRSRCQICVFRSLWLQNGFDVAWAVRNQGGASKEAVVVTQEVNCLCRYTCEEHFELLPPTPQAGSRPAPEVWRGLQVGLPALCILPALSPPPLPPLFPAFYLDQLLRTGSWTLL